MSVKDLSSLCCSECNFPMGWIGSEPHGYIICNNCAEKLAEEEDKSSAAQSSENK